MAKIGPLDQLVTLRQVTTTADGIGGAVEAWSDFATDANVWADVFPAGGSERLEDGGFNASGSFVFVIRNRSDVTERDGILWNSEHYNIRRVERRGGRELYLRLNAERGVPK